IEREGGWRLVPSRATATPPAEGALRGATRAIVGASSQRKPWSRSAAPPVVATRTVPEPAACAGTVPVIVVGVIATLVSATPPTLAVVLPGMKPVPVIVTAVGSALAPSAGEIDARVGG